MSATEHATSLTIAAARAAADKKAEHLAAIDVSERLGCVWCVRRRVLRLSMT